MNISYLCVFFFLVVSLRSTLGPIVSRPLSPYDVPRSLPFVSSPCSAPASLSAVTSDKSPVCPPRTPVLGMSFSFFRTELPCL